MDHSLNPIIISLWNTILKGGWVMLPLFLCGCWAWILIIERTLYLGFLHLECRKVHPFLNQFSQILKLKGSFYIRGLQNLIRYENLNDDAKNLKFLEVQMQSELLTHRGLNTISRLAGVAPLIGLLGTVSGMIHTFTQINTGGMVNASMLSSGISEALIATQSGLITALPLMLAHHILSYFAENLDHKHLMGWREIYQNHTPTNPL